MHIHLKAAVGLRLDLLHPQRSPEVGVPTSCMVDAAEELELSAYQQHPASAVVPSPEKRRVAYPE
jgi:hypothetical protein